MRVSSALKGPLCCPGTFDTLLELRTAAPQRAKSTFRGVGSLVWRQHDSLILCESGNVLNCDTTGTHYESTISLGSEDLYEVSYVVILLSDSLWMHLEKD